MTSVEVVTRFRFEGEHFTTSDWHDEGTYAVEIDSAGIERQSTIAMIRAFVASAQGGWAGWRPEEIAVAVVRWCASTFGAGRTCRAKVVNREGIGIAETSPIESDVVSGKAQSRRRVVDLELD